MAVAARFTATAPWRRSDAVGNEGQREVDLKGEAQRPRGRAGASGRQDRGGGAWRPYPLLDTGEGGPAGTRPCSDPGRGNREGERATRGTGRVGRMGQVGRPGCELGRLVQGFFLFLLFYFHLFFFYLFYFLFYII